MKGIHACPAGLYNFVCRWIVNWAYHLCCVRYGAKRVTCKGWTWRVAGLGVTAFRQNFVGINVIEVKGVEFSFLTLRWFEVLWIFWTPEWFLRYSNLCSRNWELVTTQEQTWRSESSHECRNPYCKAARATAFCTMEPNVMWALSVELLSITHMALRILTRLPDLSETSAFPSCSLGSVGPFLAIHTTV